MTVQWRTGLSKALPMVLSLAMTCSLLCSGIVSVLPAKTVLVSAWDATLLSTVIVVPPTQVVDPLTGVKDDQTNVMWNLLDGWVATQGGNDLNNVRYVNYPQSFWFFTGFGDPPVDVGRDIGATNLNTLINATAGQTVVVGYSQGASVNTRWLDWYKAGKLPSTPDPSQLSFVNAGNPNRPNGGMAERFVGLYVPGFGVTFDGATPSDTPYPATEIAHEYDGFSDFPKYVLNPLADINALMGILFVHPFYDQINLNDPTNIVTRNGNLTDILVRTSVLPIMQPFYIMAHLLGRTQTPILDAVSGPLRVVIDSAYDRTTAKATPADFGNPFQNLNLTTLKDSVTQSVETLTHASPAASATTTFTQFPDLGGIAKVLTVSPLDMSALNQASVQSAEKYLYGTPKTPVAAASSVGKQTESQIAPQQQSVAVSQPTTEPQLGGKKSRSASAKDAVSESAKDSTPELTKRIATKSAKKSVSASPRQKPEGGPREVTKRTSGSIHDSATSSGKPRRATVSAPSKHQPAGRTHSGAHS